MSREIEYRFWNTKHDWMTTWDTAKRYKLEEYLDRENEIPLQYTGLKDNNGVKIFEGDIVTDDIYGFRDCHHIIEFEERWGGILQG